ncbi:dynamin family protein [Achromobacter spanius]|uniref:dynamin family protein n=1 Tax=Achromobacter spanius TaxID=217203 RepID=UPI00320ABE03
MDVSINDLQQETLRLIALQTEILSKIEQRTEHASIAGKKANREAVKSVEPDVDANMLSVEAIHAKKKVLEEHRIKVERLDMVLAVVGTMKAGKSTTINAIVGREILPNRNRPMTALPTLIRHCPGQIEPVLKFENRQPIADLVKKLKTRVDGLSEKTLEKRTAEDENLEEILRQVRRGALPKAKYQGEDGIYRFLSYLNDLVRLSAELDVPFPFSKYASIEDFPVIEVEFFHLSGLGSDGSGRFSILDTPGFNEAGQKDTLLPMMRDQLEKASAVLAVLDYTQLKSDSEEDLREELNAIASTAGGRMFALVNKFDAHDRNSADASKTRAYVANHLLDNAGIKPENIYPVSARRAYLAQQALLAVEQHGRLEWNAESANDRWIPDFGKEVLGIFWERQIADPQIVKAAAESLWNESNFADPLQDVIHFGYASAAFQAIDAATARLAQHARELDLVVTSRQQMLKADAADIKELLKVSKSQIRALSKIRASAEEDLRTQISDVSKSVAAGQGRVGKEVQKAIQDFLKKGALEIRAKIRLELAAALKSFKAFQDAGRDEREAMLNHVAESASLDLEQFDIALERLKKKKKTASLEDLRVFFSQEQADAPAAIRIAGISILMGGKRSRQKEVQVISSDAVYGSREEAQKKLTEVEGALRKLLNGSRASLELLLEDAHRDLHEKMQALTADITARTSQFSDNAAIAGVAALKFDVPEVPLIRAPQALAQHKASLIDDQSRRVRHRVEQSGIFGWLKRRVDYFGGDWGYDERGSTESRFVIDMNKLQAHWTAMLADESAMQKHVVQEEFAEPITRAGQRFFEAIEGRFALIQESLEEGLRDHEESEQTRADIARFLAELDVQKAHMQDDLKTLSRTVGTRVRLLREATQREAA